MNIRKFVWDTSALLNLKEPDGNGYSPANSLFKDLSDGIIKIPYLHIFPAIAVFELQATVSRKRREGFHPLREFYLLDENSTIYEIDRRLIQKSSGIMPIDGFDRLRGAELVFACIAYLEGAFLVTLDNHFGHIAKHVEVIDLRDSKLSPEYRRLFERQ